MTALSTFFVAWSLLVVPIVIAGLLFRKSYKQCVSFLLYLTLVWVGDLLLFAWPTTFQTWDFWMPKETIYLVIKLVTVLELSRRMFGAFPGALALAERTVLVACAVLLGILVVNWPPVARDRSWIW